MNKFLNIALIAATLVSFTACGDDDYTAGAEPAANAPLVYFSSSNESEVLITDGSETGFDVTLCRKDTAAALTVPIVVDYCVGNLSIPSSVDFAAGDSAATLHISFDGYVAGTKATIRIPDEYVNPYLKLDGSISFNVKLVKLDHVGSITYEAGNRFEFVTSQLYAYDGENKFLWKDFLGSGLDLKFTVNTDNTTGAKYDADDLTKLKGDITPLTNYTYNSAGGWYLTRGTDNEDYVQWTPAGQSEAITSFFYWDYANGGSYSFIDFDPGTTNQGYGYFYAAYVNDVGYETFYFFINY